MPPPQSPNGIPSQRLPTWRKSVPCRARTSEPGSARPIDRLRFEKHFHTLRSAFAPQARLLEAAKRNGRIDLKPVDRDIARAHPACETLSAIHIGGEDGT